MTRRDAVAGFKVSGAGNDFIALVEPSAAPDPATIRRWCRRGLGIGADGVFTLERGRDSVRMRHWNADGSESDLCVNGTRCAARLAFEFGWATGRTTIVTGAGAVAARDAGDDRVEIDAPAPGPVEPLTLEIPGGELSGHRIDTGVPHFAVAVDDDLAALDLAGWGPAVRHHERLAPAGANADFYRVLDRDRIELRTWERGVEGETLACGTGALAVAAIASHLGSVDFPLRVRTAGGYDFEISAALGEEAVDRWSLIGDARIVARLEILAGAADGGD